MTPRPMSKAWVCSSTVCYRQRFLGLAGAGGDMRAAPLGVWGCVGALRAINCFFSYFK